MQGNSCPCGWSLLPPWHSMDGIPSVPHPTAQHNSLRLIRELCPKLTSHCHQGEILPLAGLGGSLLPLGHCVEHSSMAEGLGGFCTCKPQTFSTNFQV